MLLVVLAAVWAFFYFATDGMFLTQRNLVLLALQTAIVSLAAISAVMLIVTRNFDLSVGSRGGAGRRRPRPSHGEARRQPARRRRRLDRAGLAHGRLAGMVGDACRRLVLHRDARRHALFPRHLDDRDERSDRRAAAEVADRLRHRLPSARRLDCRRHRGARSLRGVPADGVATRSRARSSRPARPGACPRTRGARDRGDRRDLDRLLAGHTLPRPARRDLHDRRRIRHAPHALWRAALCDRRQSGSGPPLRHRPAARRSSGIS